MSLSKISDIGQEVTQSSSAPERRILQESPESVEPVNLLMLATVAAEYGEKLWRNGLVSVQKEIKKLMSIQQSKPASLLQSTSPIPETSEVSNGDHPQPNSAVVQRSVDSEEDQSNQDGRLQRFAIGVRKQQQQQQLRLRQKRLRQRQQQRQKQQQQQQWQQKRQQQLQQQRQQQQKLQHQWQQLQRQPQPQPQQQERLQLQKLQQERLQQQKLQQWQQKLQQKWQKQRQQQLQQQEPQQQQLQQQLQQLQQQEPQQQQWQQQRQQQEPQQQPTGQQEYLATCKKCGLRKDVSLSVDDFISHIEKHVFALRRSNLKSRMDQKDEKKI